MAFDFDPTTTPFNYQYDDIIDDEDGFFEPDKNEIIKTSFEESLIQSNNFILTTSTLESYTNDNNSSLEINVPKDNQPNYDALMNHHKDESNEFRIAIICIGLTLIATGVCANLFFKLLVVCRKGKRQTCTTLTMLSMSLAYLIFLVFYSIKLSVNVSGDNITKFHIYDTIDNWIYGQFMCQLISGLPFCVKLISRLSILALVAKRVFNIMICDCNEELCVGYKSDELSDEISEETRLKSNNGSETISNRGSHFQKRSNALQKFKVIKKVFEWPVIIILIVLIWIISIGATWPIFSSYKLSETSNEICDTVYQFPDDVEKIRFMFLNYLIYGLGVPCFLIIILLGVLNILQSNYCTKSSSPNTSSPSSSPNKKNPNLRTASSLSSNSFDETNTSNSLSNHNQSCVNSKGSSLILWIMLFIHLATSIPQEVYRYLQLSIDFKDENVLEDYFTSVLVYPITKARSYYAMQLFYITEFVLMPIVFILFFLCSNSVSKSADFNLVKKTGKFEQIKSCFYDRELSKGASSTQEFLKVTRKTKSKRPNFIHNVQNNDVLLPISRENSIKIVKKSEAIPLSKSKHNTKRSGSSSTSSSQMQPTPFEMATNMQVEMPETSYYSNGSNNNNNNNNNVLHVIQHPSWRINIKQNPTHSLTQTKPSSLNTNYDFYNDEFNGNGIQLPVNYIRTNGFNS